MNIQKLEKLKEFCDTINPKYYDQGTWEECNTYGCLAKHYSNKEDSGEVRDELSQEFDLDLHQELYLFGSQNTIINESQILGLSFPESFTLEDAQERIDNLINLQKQRDAKDKTEK